MRAKLDQELGNAVSPTHMHIEILIRFILLFIVPSGLLRCRVDLIFYNSVPVELWRILVVE